MGRKFFWVSLGMIFSVLFCSVPPLPGQVKTADKSGVVEVESISEPKEIFRKLLQSSRDGMFPQLVKKIGGNSYTEGLENTLETETVNFYEAMNEISQASLPKVTAKAKELSQKNYEELKKTPPRSRPEKAPKNVRRGGPSFIEEEYFDLQPENPASYLLTNFPAKNFTAEDQPILSTVETETGVQIKGSASKSIELAGAIITHSENADAKTYFDGKGLTLDEHRVQKTEAVSREKNQKLTKTAIFDSSISFNNCPDADGVVPGKLKVRINSQTVLIQGKELIALTTDWEAEFKVTAYVNEDAVMTHFDMEGFTVEKNTGYERARQLGLVEVGNEFQDGSSRINYTIMNSTPPSEVEGKYGRKEKVYLKPGEFRNSYPINLPPEQVARIDKFTGYGVSLGLIKLEPLMRSSIYKWQNGECVDVECSAAKNTLRPGELIDVKAVSISKQDLSNFKARLEGRGSESVSPEKQFGTPTAVYNLTATSDGTAVITVKSISRRGIGLGMLEFGKSILDEDPICDGNWQGTIEIRKAFEETFKKTTKPGEISSNLQMSGYQETINRYRYEGTVKTAGVKVKTATVSLLNATYDASAEKYFFTHGNFTEPGECGWNKPTTVKVDSGTELTENTNGQGATDITIQVEGNSYRGSVEIPKINGTYFRRIWHHPAGYCQPGNNKASDQNENDKTYFDRVSFVFEGTVDPKQPDVLNGTKITSSPDGKESTIITWRLKRCVPARGKRNAR